MQTRPNPSRDLALQPRIFHGAPPRRIRDDLTPTHRPTRAPPQKSVGASALQPRLKPSQAPPPAGVRGCAPRAHRSALLLQLRLGARRRHADRRQLLLGRRVHCRSAWQRAEGRKAEVHSRREAGAALHRRGRSEAARSAKADGPGVDLAVRGRRLSVRSALAKASANRAGGQGHC